MNPFRRTRARFSLAAAWTAFSLGSVTLASDCRAEGGRAASSHGSENPPPRGEQSLRSVFELQRLEQGLNQRGEERLRNLARLSTNGSKAAIEVITRWLDEDAASLDLEEWLAVCRALAPHARFRASLDWLGRIFGGAPLSAAPGDSRFEALTRGTAAVALARLGSNGSLTKLGRALRQGSTLARLGQTGLLAHPPRDLAPILQAPGAPTEVYIETLELLGDQRAFMPLRELVRRGSPEVAGRAALALHRMGHLETVALAEHWLDTATEHEELLAAATEILLTVSAPTANSAVEKLLSTNPTRAIDLLRRVPSPHGLAALSAQFDELAVPLRRLALDALATSTEAADADRLGRALKTAGLEHAAALALARAPSPRAKDLLVEHLDGKQQASAVRALVVRSWLRSESITELDHVLATFSASKNPTQQWLADWARAVASPDQARQLLESKDAESVGAAAATLLVQPEEVVEHAAMLLDASDDRTLLPLLAAALARSSGAQHVATSTLNRLNQLQPELELLTAKWRAARALPGAFHPSAKPADATVERAVLDGLGENPEPAALGLLRNAYGRSPDPHTRRAAIRGLSRQSATGPRRRLLQQARDFDPDPGVRQLARFAATGAVHDRVGGRQVVWLDLGRSAGGQLVFLTTGAGDAFCLRAPPDGVVVVLGSSDQPVNVRWAPRSP